MTEWTDMTIKGAQARYGRVSCAARNRDTKGLVDRLEPMLAGAGADTKSYAKAQGDAAMWGAREFVMQGNRVGLSYSAVCWYAIAGERELAQAAAVQLDKSSVAFHDGSYKRGAGYILRTLIGEA